MTVRKYRMAQWGTGNVGRRTLRAIIEHPDMELVALRVFSDAKADRDAGELCGAGHTGVRATRNIEDVLAAKPDCVIYLPDLANLDDMCRLLEGGVNISTACLGFNHRASIAANERARLESACARGRSSLYSTGSSPGWSTELMPLTLMTMQRHFECLTIIDYADMSTRNSPMMLARLGFGADPATMDKARQPATLGSTTPSFRALADAVGLPLDEIAGNVEYAVTRKHETIAIGPIGAGTIGAIRMAVIGLRNGEPLLKRYSTWYIARDLDPSWELRDSGWRMQVKGDTSLDVSIVFDVADGDYADYSPGLTAHPVVNVAPYVVEAEPGILETNDLPMIVPTLIKRQ
jgi:4-hydroxy-tetrahydrodipicolinate reductase